MKVEIFLKQNLLKIYLDTLRIRRDIGECCSIHSRLYTL